MILKDWLKKNGIKPYVFAKSIGMAPATIYRNLAGNQRMSARFAVKVEAETKGGVSRTEAIWPEAFSEKDENGEEQFTALPKIENKDYDSEDKT